MRVLAACSLGGAGHFTPLLGFLEHQQGRNDVVVAGPPALSDLVAAARLEFWPCGEPPEAQLAPMRDQLALAAEHEASVLGNRELFGRLAAAAMLPGMARVFEEWSPDFVLRDPCEYASAVLANRTGTPTAQVAISFADVEASSIKVASPALEEHEPGLTGVLLESPYLTRFPQTLDPSSFPATVRYREPARTSRDALPDWWKGSAAPLVYVTLGTVLGYMSFASDVFDAVLRSIRSLDARVLVTTGRHFDPAVLGPMPAHVHVERWVDQDDVLGTASLVVCHGGSGTVLGALQASVPLVIVPTFADQFENARRVAAAGAGRVVTSRSSGSSARLPPSLEDAPAITAAIEEVLGDEAYRGAAQRIHDEMHAAPLAAEALASVLGARSIS